MCRRLAWLLVLFLAVFGVTPAQAAELVNPITLYQESVKVESMIKQGESPAKVLPALDALSDMYTRLDPRKIHQRVEGQQAVTAELIALKQMFAAVKGPEQAVAEYRIHRLTVAFDSLAYPASSAWLPIARSMENNLDKLIEAVAKGDQKAARTIMAKLRQERDQIQLALQLHGHPAELNAQWSAHRFVELQLTAEQVTDKQGTLDALGSYKASLGNVTSQFHKVEEPPFLPVLHLTLDPVMYGTAGATILAIFGWRMFRKKKN
ncbi:sporulation protein YpjB [Tumebacillus sp. BK434]|uniref:sporulation protein YpjB n=1 Tax=Tumebacillus sp. BK434 TaxID=2512169 RepID=UPI0010460436|nr:sporulation protein YpjB [Tumebacillus sp. BK434]TCP58955.1 sporulation protein YpjB [Tumebacillus sp. BK434]